ncbi:hypothetical protein [Caldilinea sp.]|uniref:hypothetical protein n=1 Tax=Caldilinea sp. TaxID=2293560 RepID=UPI0021DD3359|nr:hypothetical protein [Caldilinea sp.]GIV73541.1 MAG: hypothetical protein KatS3mg049_2097 [Caldilinea sp.]
MPAVRTGIRWVRPPDTLARAVERYGDRVLTAVQVVAERMATVLQNDARANAPWTDRTGNARSGLFGTSERDLARRLVVIYLSHGPDIDYGKWLELAHGGRYSIVMKTIEAHLPELKADLDAIFR